MNLYPALRLVDEDPRQRRHHQRVNCGWLIDGLVLLLHACSAAEAAGRATTFNGRVMILSFIDDLGWGNRMPSIVTAAVMALLTNRALYLE